MIRRPPRSTQGVSSAASDVYKRQLIEEGEQIRGVLKEKITQDNQITEYKLANLVPKPVSYTHLRAHET